MTSRRNLTALCRILVPVIIALAFTPASVRAQATPNPPGQMSYQGFLVDANGIPLATNAPKNYDVIFRIYNQPTGPTNSPLWAELQTVTVDRGYFSVMLGQGSSVGQPFTNNLTSVFSGSDASDRYLGTTVRGLAGGDVEMAPRLRLQASPYAFLAATANNSVKLAGYDWSAFFNSTNPATGSIPGSRILAGSITSAQITNGAIGSVQIANGAVGSNQIAIGAVGASQIASNGVTTSDIADGAVTSSKIAMPVSNLSASGNMTLAGDLLLSGGLPYHNLSLSGGNTFGYLYGAYNTYGDGIHLGYNYYVDGNNVRQMPAVGAGSGTSRLSLGYGWIRLYVGGASTYPDTLRLEANTSGVSVFGTFNNSSDRNAKQDFTPVSPSEILDKVLQLPITEWSYKTDSATRHLGPMGQDFYSAFKIGTDEKHLAPIDEGGVALAAIQGLNQKLEGKESEIQQLKQALAELREQVSKLAAERESGAR
jgi:hypothetical protein